MGLLVTIKLGKASVKSAYVKVNSPGSYKHPDSGKLMLRFDYEAFDEKGGTLLKVEHNILCEYKEGNVYEEAYNAIKELPGFETATNA